MMNKIKAKFKEMIPNPLSLVTKLFCLLWFFLILQIVLKLTFDYWQPYVIPTSKLENLGNYIDSHRWLQASLNGMYYVINLVIMFLCGVQQWWFKNKKEMIIIIGLFILSFLSNVFLGTSNIMPFITTLLIPIIYNWKKTGWILLTFALNNLFILLSLWLEGFTNTDTMNYIVGTFFTHDYYIMLLLNYMLFNIIRIKKGGGITMGERLGLSWFARKSLDELYEIKEKEWNKMSEEARKELLEAIALKEGK